MGNLIKPQVKVMTKDGECQINIVLELNINLNEKSMKSPLIIEETLEIPDFSSKEKISFGEIVK